MHINWGVRWGTQLSDLCTGCVIRCVLCYICVGLRFSHGGQCSGTQGSTRAQEMLLHQRIVRRKGADTNLPERDTMGNEMVFVRVPWGWDVSSKRECLISIKWRNDGRNVFVLEQTRNDLEPGMFFMVSRLLESSMFSLMTPGSPCPEPASGFSLVFILQCFPLSPTWGNTQASMPFRWISLMTLSILCPVSFNSSACSIANPIGKVPYLVLCNRSVYLWRQVSPLCFSVKMH